MRFLAVNEWRRHAKCSHTTWESKSVCSGHGHKLPQSHRWNAARAADPTDKIIAPLIWHIVIIIFHWILCCLHTLTRNVFFQADATLTRTDDYWLPLPQWRHRWFVHFVHVLCIFCVYVRGFCHVKRKEDSSKCFNFPNRKWYVKMLSCDVKMVLKKFSLRNATRWDGQQ